MTKKTNNSKKLIISDKQAPRILTDRELEQAQAAGQFGVSRILWTRD